MSFDGLIGNDKIKTILTDSVKNGNILHSYIFYGTEGIGKKLFAMEFAKMILCMEDEVPCQKCKSCIQFDSNNNPDFFFIEPDKTSLKIEQIRAMQKNILEKPVNGKKKVYILNDADKMTKEAQNCLLKTLEEPQSFVVIILVCSNENNILPTVKSRCTKIYFDKIDTKDIISYLKEKYTSINLDEDVLELCSGSITKAINIIDKNDILSKVKNIVNTVDKTDKLKFLSNNEIFYTNKDDVDILLEYMYLQMYKYITHNNKLQSIQAINYIHKAELKLYNSNNFDMTIDNMLINIWEEFNEKHNRS